MRVRGFILMIAAAALAAGCTSAGQSAASRSPAATPSSRQAAASGGGCLAQPLVSPLPTWARAGFSDPAAPHPHVLGADGDIVAILWAVRDPLHAPPLADRANKILWVSRLPVLPLSPLKIQATLAGTSLSVSREVIGGPGPSYVDLPAAGCWTLALSWSGHTDQVKLRYATG
jgi:hypothetical protein